MPKCLPGSLRSMQLPLDHLVEKRDIAVRQIELAKFPVMSSDERVDRRI